jgi:hypothetical protein
MIIDLDSFSEIDLVFSILKAAPYPGDFFEVTV